MRRMCVRMLAGVNYASNAQPIRRWEIVRQSHWHGNMFRYLFVVLLLLVVVMADAAAVAVAAVINVVVVVVVDNNTRSSVSSYHCINTHCGKSRGKGKRGNRLGIVQHSTRNVEMGRDLV